MRKILNIIAISLSMLAFSQNPGALDNTFDSNGLFDGIYAGSGIKTMVQPNSDVVLVFKDKFGESFISRLNAVGAVDNTFGVAGSNSISAGNSFNVNDAVQSGNHFLSCGRINSVAAVASFSTTGFEVSTFGTLGYASFPSAGNVFHCIDLQSDGKLVMGGEFSNFATISRILPNGSLDTGFGTNGTMTISPSAGQTSLKLFGIAIESNGKIILTGEKTYTNNIVRSCTVRLNSNGSLDGTFGTGGVVELILPYDFSGTNRVMLYAGNSYILSGSAYMNNANSDFLVIKLNSNGSFDNTFGASNGYSAINLLGHELSEGLCKQSDGKILLGGYTSVLANTNLFCCILRLNINGSVDLGFGNNAGFQTFNVPSYSNSMAFNLAIDAQERLYTTGGGGLCGPDQCYSGFVMVSRHTNVSDPNGFGELQKNENSMMVFPNPASSFLKVKNETQANKIVIYDVNGKMIICSLLDKGTLTLDLSEFSSGIYTCVLLNGTMPVTQQKLVVLPKH